MVRLQRSLIKHGKSGSSPVGDDRAQHHITTTRCRCSGKGKGREGQGEIAVQGSEKLRQRCCTGLGGLFLYCSAQQGSRPTVARSLGRCPAFDDGHLTSTPGPEEEEARSVHWLFERMMGERAEIQGSGIRVVAAHHQIGTTTGAAVVDFPPLAQSEWA